jgi:LacI family transcriptional regulator
MATIYEVSARAGVSLATVSRVVNSKGRVADKTRQRVLSAIAELDYRPNSIAQSLASSRSNSVGILVPELHGPFFGTMVSGIEETLRAAGKHVIVTIGHSDADKEQDAIDFLAGRRCDALILHVEALDNAGLLQLGQGEVPIVIMNRLVAGLEGQCIRLDNFRGGYIASSHLLELGHREIACITGPLWKSDAAERLRGHRTALTEHDVLCNETLIAEGDFQESGGSKAMEDLLQTGLPFTAVVCGNDSMAAGAMRTAREHGLQIPDQLSIVGFDNVSFARYLYPRLSTIDFPAHDMGEMAARWVMRHVYNDESLAVQNVFEPFLIERETARRRLSADPQ